RFRYYRGWELALLAGLAVLGNFAFRSAMDWLLVMLMLGVPHLKAMLADAARANRQRPLTARLLRLDRVFKKTLQTPLLALQPLWPALACLVLVAISIVPALSRDMPVQNSERWPAAALDHVQAAGWSGKFFGPPDYGAYIGWRLGERGKVYADTRGFFFPP